MNRLLSITIPLGIIAVGVVVMMALVETKGEPDKKESGERRTLVDTIHVERTRQAIRIDAKGTVIPAREVQLQAEVSGRVLWMATELVPGGRFRKGESLLRLDGRDYSLAVEQQNSAVARARTELKMEESRKKVAEREWELFGPSGKGESKPSIPPSSKTPGPAKGSVASAGTAAETVAPVDTGDTSEESGGEERLALREPQLRSAKVAVAAATSGLDRAKLAVSKTVLRAPFNGMVRQRHVEIGQIVGPAAPVAVLVGTDSYWVQVSVPMDTLAWLDIPGVGKVGQLEGSLASITQEVGGKSISRPGRVVRLLGDVDPMGRMARLLVEIEDPLGLQGPGTTLPLLLGSYVRVEIEGEELEDVIVLPRLALREGNKVYVMRKDGTLEIRSVDVVWRRESEVLLASGLEASDDVVISAVSTPVDGLPLRTREPAQAAK